MKRKNSDINKKDIENKKYKNNRMCIHPTCEIQAYFGKKGKLAEYCSEHKLPGYVDIKNKKCIHPNCEIQAYFGKKGSKLAEYCSEHKLPGYIDVKHKKCIHPN